MILRRNFRRGGWELHHFIFHSDNRQRLHSASGFGRSPCPVESSGRGRIAWCTWMRARVTPVLPCCTLCKAKSPLAGSGVPPSVCRIGLVRDAARVPLKKEVRIAMTRAYFNG